MITATPPCQVGAGPAQGEGVQRQGIRTRHVRRLHHSADIFGDKIYTLGAVSAKLVSSKFERHFQFRPGGSLKSGIRVFNNTLHPLEPIDSKMNPGVVVVNMDRGKRLWARHRLRRQPPDPRLPRGDTTETEAPLCRPALAARADWLTPWSMEATGTHPAPQTLHPSSPPPLRPGSGPPAHASRTSRTSGEFASCPKLGCCVYRPRGSSRK